MRPHRWPALLVIPAVLVGGVLLERSRDERPADEPEETTATLEEQGLLPVAAPGTALGATWYCAGGEVGGDDDAEHSVIVANPSERDLQGTVTVYGDASSAGPVIVDPPPIVTVPPDTGDDDDPDATTTTSTTTSTVPPTTTTTSPPIPAVSVPYEVLANSSVEVDLGAVEGVQDGYTAALVEVDGGETVVEHRVSDDNGTDVSPCSSTASPTWYFAAGATTQDATETLVFFNPFPDDAVVDVSFRTDQDLRTPEAFEGIVIPGQSVVARDVGEVVTRREHVSASVVARSGRIIVDRIQSYDGSDDELERQGLTVALGAPEPAETWYFPEGTVGDGIDEQIVVFNPTDQRAEVDLEITTDDPERNGQVEPFELTIPPEGFETILLNEEARITSARGGEGALAHATVVRSVNGVPVVAERQSFGGAESQFPGVDMVLGAPLLADEFVLAAGATGDGGLAVVIFNPASSADATVTINALADGEVTPIDGLEGLTVPGGGRLAVVIDDADDGVALVVSADQPVVVERRLVFEDDVSSAIGVPVAGSLTEPPT